MSWRKNLWRQKWESMIWRCKQVWYWALTSRTERVSALPMWPTWIYSGCIHVEKTTELETSISGEITSEALRKVCQKPIEQPFLPSLLRHDSDTSPLCWPHSGNMYNDLWLSVSECQVSPFLPLRISHYWMKNQFQIEGFHLKEKTSNTFRSKYVISA